MMISQFGLLISPIIASRLKLSSLLQNSPSTFPPPASRIFFPKTSGESEDSNGKITPLKMEAPRSVGGRIQRKPLADCTNIVSRSSQEPSSPIKYPNLSLSSSLKRILDQTTFKEKIKDVNASVASSGSVSRSLSSNARPVTRRTSVDLGSPASAPSRPKTSRSDLGVSDKDISGSLSAYTITRKASRQKWNKDASSSSAAARLRLDLTSSSSENKTKLLKVAPRKRQRTVKSSVDAATEEYIEQQKAYFAEIDAFELPEEDVSSSDSD